MDLYLEIVRLIASSLYVVCSAVEAVGTPVRVQIVIAIIIIARTMCTYGGLWLVLIHHNQQNTGSNSSL